MVWQPIPTTYETHARVRIGARSLALPSTARAAGGAAERWCFDYGFVCVWIGFEIVTFGVSGGWFGPLTLMGCAFYFALRLSTGHPSLSLSPGRLLVPALVVWVRFLLGLA